MNNQELQKIIEDLRRAGAIRFDSDYLRKVAVKTGEEISVPLRKAAKDIIERLMKRGLKPKPNAVYNEEIKAVGRLCRINQDVLIIKGKRKHKPGDIVRKYLLMSTHMARATFICQMIHFDVHSKKIKKMTGIKSNQTLDHYEEVVDVSLTESMERVERLQGF